MHSTIKLAALAAYLFNLQQASAVPTPNLQPRGAVTLTQVKNDKFTANGVAARAKPYLKYKKSMPSDLEAALQALGSGSSSSVETFELVSGSATATPADAYDSEYLVPVSIGTPATTFNLDLDTGSSDLWVFGPEVTAATSNHTIYNPSQSSTSQTTDDTWQISYGDGSSASGNAYLDVVDLGGVSTSSQAVEQANQASSQFIETTGDGLMGLAFESINTCTPQQQTPFWQTVSSKLSDKVFVADLRHQEAGSYTFGAIPSGASSATYISVDKSQGFWGMSASGYGISGSKKSSSSISGIADTGTTLLLLDNSIVSAYYNSVSGAYYDNNQAGYLVPSGASLPSFQLYVGKTPISVPGSYLCYQDLGDGYCYGGIQSDDGLGMSIFGDIVLKAAYVVFDFGNTKIGWAQKST